MANDKTAPATGDQPAAPAPAAAPAAALPSVPASWPGAFGAYKYSKAAVMTNIGTLIIIWVLNVVAGLILQALLKSAGSLASFIVDGLFAAAYILVYVGGVRRQRLEIGDSISKAVNYWLPMLGLNILLGVTAIVTLLLLIIPFFIVMPRLALAPYYLVDKDLGVMDAYKASWEATRGNVGKVYGIIGAAIVMVLLMLTIIGIPFSIYFLIMYSGAWAVLYEFVQKSQPQVAAKPAAPAAASAA